MVPMAYNESFKVAPNGSRGVVNIELPRAAFVMEIQHTGPEEVDGERLNAVVYYGVFYDEFGNLVGGESWIYCRYFKPNGDDLHTIPPGFSFHGYNSVRLNQSEFGMVHWAIPEGGVSPYHMYLLCGYSAPIGAIGLALTADYAYVGSELEWPKPNQFTDAPVKWEPLAVSPDVDFSYHWRNFQGQDAPAEYGQVQAELTAKNTLLPPIQGDYIGITSWVNLSLQRSTGWFEMNYRGGGMELNEWTMEISGHQNHSLAGSIQSRDVMESPIEVRYVGASGWVDEVQVEGKHYRPQRLDEVEKSHQAILLNTGLDLKAATGLNPPEHLYHT